MGKIMVTGATGHLGHLVIQQLLQQVPAHHIVALVRDPAKAASLAAQGVIIRTGDYHQPETLHQALQDIESLMLISSNDFNQRFTQHKNVVDAAVAAGVQHIAYTGLAIRDIAASPLQPLLGDHFQTEEYILSKGIQYTFLRNALYQEVLPMFVGEQVLQTGLFFPAGDGKTCFVSREDLAEASARVLTQPEHRNKTYTLTGPATPDFQEIAQYIGQASNQSVPYLNPGPEVFASTLEQAGVPVPMIQFSAAFAAAIAQQDFDLQSTDLEAILGRPATSVAQYLHSVYAPARQEV